MDAGAEAALTRPRHTVLFCLTGAHAAPVIAEANHVTRVLPSSSPANAILSFDQKLRLWRDILT